MNRWITFAFCAMLLNGTAQTIQNCLPVRFTNQFLAVMYIFGGLICWSIAVARRCPVRLKHFAIGAAAGAVSYVGNVFLIRSLSLRDGSIVFPVVFGSSMVVVTLVSAIGFKEKLTLRGICAVIVGIASVVILSRS